MSFTLQRENLSELVQNTGDLNDRLTGWRFNVQPGRELTLTLGLARSICIKSPTVRRFVCDSALTWISVPSLVIFSYILFLFFFLFYFCRRRSHQYLLLFINSFTNDTFYACLNSKTNSDFDWGDSWALCLLFFLVAHLNFIFIPHILRRVYCFSSSLSICMGIHPTCSGGLIAIGVCDSADLWFV